jgi:hypothetical protein
VTVKNNHRNSKALFFVPVIAGAISAALTTQSAHAQTYFSIDRSNASVGTMNLSSAALPLGNLQELASGSNPYKYATVSFTPTTSSLYTFGQTSAPVDTVMVLYQGAFNPASPRTGALVANDDTSQSLHRAATNNPSLSTLCGNIDSFCPQVKSQVVAGQKYTVLVSTFASGAQFDLPLAYYSDGSGEFKKDDGVIDIVVNQIVATVVAPQIQRATTVQQASIISSVVSNIFSARAPNAPGAPVRVSLNGERGMASGNQIGSMNAWVNGAETKIGSQALASMFSGKVTNAIGGIDYTVSQEIVAGVSFGHDRVSLDFNFAGPNSGLVSTGWMIAPYVGYQINETLSADAALGYASGDVDTRTSTGPLPSETYSRNFLALNLTSTHWMDDIQFLAKVNYISANEKVGTTNKMEQLRLGGQVGYWMDGIMPYASVTYVRDIKISTGGIQPVGPDKEAWTVVIGANLFSKGAMYGGVSLSKEYGRTDSSNQVFMANIGYRF